MKTFTVELTLDQMEEISVALDIHIGSLQKRVRDGYESKAFKTPDYKKFLVQAKAAQDALDHRERAS
jgi:hypothetical protein